MTLTEPIKTCLSKYFTISGRASRSEFWSLTFFCALGLLVVQTNKDTAFVLLGYERKINVLACLFGSFVFAPWIATCLRRFQDIGKSGFSFLMAAVGFCCFRIFFYLYDPVQSEKTGVELLNSSLPPEDALSPVYPLAIEIIYFLTVAFLVISLFQMCRPSQPGPNNYGPNPHEHEVPQ